MIKTLLFALVCTLAACGGAVDATPAPCDAFDACTKDPGSLVTCADGECACTPNHAGENPTSVCTDAKR